jgi:hypothetical protein
MKKILTGVVAALPHIAVVVFFTVASRGHDIRGDIFSARFYDTALDFIIPWGFLAFMFLCHLIVAVLAVRKASLLAACGSAGLMAVGYVIVPFLFMVAALPENWGTG